EARDPPGGGLVDRADLGAHLVVEQVDPPRSIGQLEPGVAGGAHERGAEVFLVAVLAPLGGWLAGAIDEVGAACAVHARRRRALRGVGLGEPLLRQQRSGIAKLGGLADGLVVGERDQRMAQAAILLALRTSGWPGALVRSS